jgi:Na+/H+ antiporter NhaC
MNFTNILYEAHSGIRWLVVLAMLGAFVYLLVGYFQRSPYTKTTHRALVIFSSLVGVQWALGILLLIVMGTFTSYQWEHAVTMTLAVLLAHLYTRFKTRPDMVRYQIGLATILGVAVIVFIGVARLPQGWMG